MTKEIEIKLTKKEIKKLFELCDFGEAYIDTYWPFSRKQKSFSEFVDQLKLKIL